MKEALKYLQAGAIVPVDMETTILLVNALKEALAHAKLDNENDLTIAYQSGYYDGKKAALAGREQNFCERCGKRTADLTTIHTCTPPKENT